MVGVSIQENKTSVATEDQGNLTLHQRILSDIETRIFSGEWPPGYHLPFEVDLAAQYGCSRMTVNKVMAQLVQSGLIERRRKSGTFVAFRRSESAVLAIRDVRSEVESLGLVYEYRLLSLELRLSTPSDVFRLGLSVGTEVLAVTCVHLGGGRAFCVEDRVIDVCVVPSAGDQDFASEPPGSWLVGAVPWSVAEHRIYAVSAGANESVRLGISVGSACLVVERQTWVGGSSVTHVRLTYPGDRHRLVAQFGP